MVEQRSEKSPYGQKINAVHTAHVIRCLMDVLADMPPQDAFETVYYGYTMASDRLECERDAKGQG